jgi:hypothetical protein
MKSAVLLRGRIEREDRGNFNKIEHSGGAASGPRHGI